MSIICQAPGSLWPSQTKAALMQRPLAQVNSVAGLQRPVCATAFGSLLARHGETELLAAPVIFLTWVEAHLAGRCRLDVSVKDGDVRQPLQTVSNHLVASSYFPFAGAVLVGAPYLLLKGVGPVDSGSYAIEVHGHDARPADHRPDLGGFHVDPVGDDLAPLGNQKNRR
ncbi:hypothetical protein EYF80_024449 [Liparis tanakae]|uniref:Uncharacterized protein n=1 Tax=Liparis tanakae TaxID=230148 RepID=A0A4Z2HJ67_9TELE|nr:hypothetical protein EYF80_024449 [Liparis tanakae]